MSCKLKKDRLMNLLVFYFLPDGQRKYLTVLGVEQDSENHYIVRSFRNIKPAQIKEEEIGFFPINLSVISKKCLTQIIQAWCFRINIRQRIYTEFVTQ